MVWSVLNVVVINSLGNIRLKKGFICETAYCQISLVVVSM